jgi:hypothetical protein
MGGGQERGAKIEPGRKMRPEAGQDVEPMHNLLIG